MRFNINSYAAVLYVDKKGKDDLTTNDGSKEKPFLTIEFAIQQVDTDNTVIMIGKGVFDIVAAPELSKSGYKLTFHGESLDTIIEIYKSVSRYSFKGEVDLFNFIIRPANSSGTDMVCYSIDNNRVNWYNVIFSSSENGSYPTNKMVAHTGSGMGESNKYYYNCTFYSVSNINDVCGGFGVAHYINCVTNLNSYNSETDDNGKYSHLCDSSISKMTIVDEYKIEDTINNKMYGVYSGDNAWIKNLFLIKENNKFYSIKPEKYTDGKYVELTNDEVQNNFEALAFEIDELVSEITIDSETFKPINKFSKIKLVSNTKFEGLFLKSIKYNKQLIVASNNFSTKIAEHIDYFKAVYEKNTNSSIKLAFSIDNGLTWKGNNFEDLSVEIPLKPYSELSEEERTKWNTAKETIATNGIDIENLESLDFNTLDFEYIRFAYVLSVTNASDVCNTSKLQWQFDAKGSMQLMDSTEVSIEVLSNSIKVTPKTEEELIKVNITNGTCSGLENPSQDEKMTTEEIKAFVAEILS